MKIKSLLLSALLLCGVTATAYAATCTTTITKKDGTKIESTVEGDSCTISLDTGLCSCS